MPVRVKAVKPKQPPISARAYRKAIRVAMERAADTIKADYERVWETWHRKPQAAAAILKNNGGDLTLTVFVRDYTGIYHYVNHGTKAHIIRPKNGRVLFFKVPFAPKTMPLSLRATSGRKGSNPVYAKLVRHPGIKPRRFDLIIARKNETTLARYLREEFEKLQ